VILPQETFVFSANAPGVSVALGGGLIPALIDASVQKSRQEAMRGDIQSIIDKVIDLDFRAEAQAALGDSLAGFPLKLAGTSVTPLIPSKAEMDRRIAATAGGKAYLRLLVHYALDPTSMTLTTRTHAQLFQEGRRDPSYAGSLIYQGQARPGAGAEGLREQMRQSIADTFKLLALDLMAGPSTGQKPKTNFPMLVNGTRVNLPSERVGGEPGQDVLRHADGALLSLRAGGAR
jgi:hypothetical protein